MNKLKRSSFLLLLAFNFANCHVAYLGVPNHLHPVQGLYVKPSSDGTSGDLYVAATEDSAVKQWLEPINYLPQQVAPITYSSSLTTTNLPGETVVTNQKRAILSSPPIKYTYAVPVSTEGSTPTNSAAITYPYSMPAAVANEGTECGDKATGPSSYYHYPWVYYSQMMSAFANAMNNMKDEKSEEGTGSKAQTQAWPYYPFQYVMVDPSTYAQAQAAAKTPVQPTTTPATVTAEAEASSSSNESA